jgi:branched-chain amino acid transport system ATP-binding protein
VTDRCVVLNYGRKICEGRFAEVAADPVVREAYLGRAYESAA